MIRVITVILAISLSTPVFTAPSARAVYKGFKIIKRYIRGSGEHIVASGNQKLPHLYDKDYGTIGYTARYKHPYYQTSHEHPYYQAWYKNPDFWAKHERPDQQLGKISTFWAQEACGQPEAGMFIKKLENDGFAFVEPKIGIIDRVIDPGEMSKTVRARVYNSDLMVALKREAGRFEYDDHGMAVLDLIFGKMPAGGSTKGRLSHAGRIMQNYFLAEDGNIFYAAIDADPPHIVNVSMRFARFPSNELAYRSDELAYAEGETIAGAYAKFVSTAERRLDNAIIVKSAGNNFPEPVDYFIRDLGDKMIPTGSVGPEGVTSHFSQASEKVVVLAPSDDYLTTEIGGVHIRFGGTSGAAPLVTRALADTMSILPKLSRDEAVTLLQKTATRTSIHTVSKVDGAGVLNHYKMLRVAEKLHDAGFNESDSVRRAILLRRKKYYDFKKEADKLRKEAQKLLTNNADANSYQKAFQKLRQAFFLDSKNMQARRTLATIYHDAGHIASAGFYDTPVDLTLGQRVTSDAPEHIRHVYGQFIGRKATLGGGFLDSKVEDIADWVILHGYEDVTKREELYDSLHYLFKRIAKKTSLVKRSQIMFDETLALQHHITLTLQLVREGKIKPETLDLILKYAANIKPQLFEKNKEIRELIAEELAHLPSDTLRDIAEKFRIK